MLKHNSGNLQLYLVKFYIELQAETVLNQEKNFTAGEADGIIVSLATPSPNTFQRLGITLNLDMTNTALSMKPIETGQPAGAVYKSAA